MTLTARTSSGEPPRTFQRLRLLTRVMTWELRRVLASRLFWFQALGFFGFLLLMTWALHAPETFDIGDNNVSLPGFVAETSAWGLVHTLPTSLLVLVLLLPFITVDGVTRDLSRRTHELLLATTLPTWAYVWGRYLASLVISLALALLFLVAILGMGWLLHLTVTNYPALEVGTVLLLWVGIVLSATILVSSLGFALGTLLPRLSTLIKIMVLVGWIMGAVVIPVGLGGETIPPPWSVNWDPTSGITAVGLLASYSANPGHLITSEAQLQQILLPAENRIPDLGWFAPHLLLAGLSLLLVLLAALAFKRSRETLS